MPDPLQPDPALPDPNAPDALAPAPAPQDDKAAAAAPPAFAAPLNLRGPGLNDLSTTAPPAPNHASDGSFGLDVALAAPRAVVGTAYDFYDFLQKSGEMMSFDLLPEWRKPQWLEPETDGGALLTNLLQVGAAYYTGGIALKEAGVTARLAELGLKGRILNNAAKGVIADTFFLDNTSNISTLLKSKQIGGPLTDFLATDKDDPLVIRRLKNAVEGVGVGAALDVVMAGFKAAKRMARASAFAEEAVASGKIKPGSAPLVEAILNETGKEVNEAVERSRMLGVEPAPYMKPAQADAVLGATGADVKNIRQFILTGTHEAEGKAAQQIADSLTHFEERTAANLPLTEQGAIGPSGNPTPGLRINPRDLTPLQRADLLLERSDMNMFPTGGTNSALAVNQAIQQLYREAWDATPETLRATTQDELVRDSVRAISDINRLGTSGETQMLVRHAFAIRGDRNAMREITIRLVGYRRTLQMVGDGLFKSLQEAGDIQALVRTNPAKLRELAESVEMAADYLRETKGLMSETGRALASNKIVASPFRPEELSPGAQKALKVGPFASVGEVVDAKDYLAARGGAQRVADTLERTSEAMAKQAGGKYGAAGALLETEALKSGRLWDVGMEYWINSLLSGPQTHVVNTVSNFMTTLYRPFERVMGGLLRAGVGRPDGMDAVRDGLTNFQQLIGGVLDTVGLLGGRYGGDSIRNAVKRSWQTGESTLLRDMSKIEGYAPAISSQGALFSPMLAKLASTRPDMAEALSTVIDNAGRTVRMPTRALAAMDELSKQLNFRARVRTTFMAEAERLKIPTEARAAFVTTKMNEAIRNGQMITRQNILDDAYHQVEQAYPPTMLADPQFKADKVDEYLKANGGRIKGQLETIDEAIGRAREVTFTEESGKGLKALKSLVNAVPVLRLFVPFISTPVNLVKFGARRSIEPLVGAMEYYGRKLTGLGGDMANRTWATFSRDMVSGDANVKADAIGRFATAVGFVSVAATLAHNSWDQHSDFAITGFGPTDPNERRLLEESGWQGNSVKVGKDYYQYGRFDPFGMIFSTVADLVNYAHFAGEKDQSALEGMLGAVQYAVANNLTNKTYLQGVGDLVDLARAKTNQEKMAVLRKYVSAGLTPNLFAQSVPMTGEYADTIRETRTILDAAVARVPWGQTLLEPRRNALGEPVKRIPSWGEDSLGRWMSFWSPVHVNSLAKDPDGVLGELARQGQPFSAPGRSISAEGVNVDLTDFKSPSGQTAADRYAQLTGEVKLKAKGTKDSLTYRQSLQRLFSDPGYKAMPEFEGDVSLGNEKTRLIEAQQETYRASARNALVSEGNSARDPAGSLVGGSGIFKNAGGVDILTYIRSKAGTRAAGIDIARKVGQVSREASARFPTEQ